MTDAVTLPLSKILGKTLNKLADRTEIARILDIESEMPDEFWRTQVFTAINRFYRYLQHQRDVSMAAEYTQLPDEELQVLIGAAEQALATGLTYAEVRNWWLTQGNFLYRRQMDAKKEAERLASQCIKVLVFLPERSPMYLAFAEDSSPQLVADAKDAHAFPVLTLSQTSKAALLEQAKEFRMVEVLFNATAIKLLVANR